MDAIFSIPVLSFLLIPAFSSYSTSLNILFFYMTWTTLVLSHAPLRVEIFGTLAVRLLFYLVPSLLFFLFDILTPSAAVVIKAHGETGLPAGSKRGKTTLKEAKVVGWSVLNLALSIAAQAGIEYILTKVLGVRSALKISIKLPMPWGIVKDLVRGFLVREALSYLVHRYILHSRGSRIARRHRSWYHSLRAPYPLTAHYDHPLPYLISTFIPTYGSATLFRFHFITYIIYLSIISMEETFAYSGYTIMPTSFFLGGIARRVDMHLLSDGEGNFGPWGILDWVCGTTVGESVEDDIRGELEEHEIEEKVRKAIQMSRKKIKEGNGRASSKGTPSKGRSRRRNS
ncbi:hypothetical protein DTO212C5_3785 [Paecilomyces variotii]|nr:hypothetical protein DTO212C5_3785 [Paecilomyces variotii]